MSAAREPDRQARIAVLGAGAWGTALAAAASRHGDTMLVARSSEAAARLAADRENTRYLPGIELPATLRYGHGLDAALAHLAGDHAPLLILGIPVAGLASTCASLAAALLARPLPGLTVLRTCKGFDAQTGELPYEISHRLLDGIPGLATGVLSGPSFAQEVARGLPVALTVASPAPHARAIATMALHGGPVRVYGSDDVIGVEIGGALKNVMAIACGIADGLELGTNARAALITRGLAEMTRLGIALGAQAATFSGLTGLGDLVLTATGDLSRNRRVGLALGHGMTLDAILADGMTAEGVRCAQAAWQRALALNVDMPITAAVCQVLDGTQTPEQAVATLLSREARATESPAHR